MNNFEGRQTMSCFLANKSEGKNRPKNNLFLGENAKLRKLSTFYIKNDKNLLNLEVNLQW